MCKNSSVMAVTLSFLMTCVVPFAMAQVLKGKDQGIIIVDMDYVAKITSIKGNTVTLKNDKGVERVFEIASASGLKVGAIAKCEGKGCQQLQIADKHVKVNRIVK